MEHHQFVDGGSRNVSERPFEKTVLNLRPFLPSE